MLNAEGKPRYWLGAYDAWHLVIPVALIAAIVAWAMAPTPPPPKRPPPPMATTQITFPPSAVLIRARQFGVVQGTAQPGARAGLFVRQIPLPEKLLAERPVSANGAFQFALTNFPPGNYGFRVEAIAADGRRSGTLEIPVTLTPEPPPQAAQKPQPAVKRPPRRRR